MPGELTLPVLFGEIYVVPMNKQDDVSVSLDNAGVSEVEKLGPVTGPVFNRLA